MPEHTPYIPALRFRALTALYDPLIALTTRERRFKARVAELADLRAGEQLLDLGCGTGTLALALKAAQPAARILGVDGDEAMLAQGRRKALARGLDVTFQEAMAQALPFADNSIDIVVSSLFFHHLERSAKEEVAAEMARVLRPEGRIVIADWGPPGDPAMALASLGIRLLDGLAPTRDNFAGRLPQVFEAAGLGVVSERDSFRTVFGRMVLYSARR